MAFLSNMADKIFVSLPLRAFSFSETSSSFWTLSFFSGFLGTLFLFTTSGLALEWGAKTPWYLMMCILGGGTRAVSAKELLSSKNNERRQSHFLPGSLWV